MPSVSRILIPTQLVDRFHLELETTATVESRFEHFAVGCAPGGEIYTVSRVTRGAKPFRSKDPTRATFGVITRYDADGLPVAAAVTEIDSDAGEPSRFPAPSGVTDCSVLPSGTVALAGYLDGTYLLDADLTTVRAAFTQPYEEEIPGAPFATSIRPTPGGRLLCLVAERHVYYGNSVPNLIAITDDPLTPAQRPTLRAIASADDRAERQTERHARSYLIFDGAPVLGANRPAPTLAALVPRTDDERFWMGVNRPPRVYTPEPLADDLFVVPVFARGLRSGGKGLPFVFALMDEAGKIQGRLEGMHPYRHSPYAGSHHRVATDPRRGRAYHLNKNGFWIWSRDGELLAMLDTTVKEFKPLAAFELRACAPNGDVVLVHPKQHLVLRIPISDSGNPGPEVVAALTDFRRQRTAAKKAYGPTDWHWTWTPERLHYL
ncbi:hypothetical protein [Nocardia sp. IFM 10818]